MIAKEDPGLTAYLKSLSRHPILTHAEELELLRRANAGDRRAEKELVRCNLRLVVKVAAKFRYRGLDFDELITEGSFGLSDAAKRYKPETGFRFTSYAVWWVRAKITKAINERGRLIRIGGHQEDGIRKYRNLPVEQHIGGDYLPKREEVAKLKYFSQAATEAITPSSLDAPMDGTEDGYAVFLPSEEPSPEEKAIQQAEAEWLAQEVHKLAAKERRVLTLLFGLKSGEPMTLGQVGDLLGVSRERVQQLRNQAVGKLKREARK